MANPTVKEVNRMYAELGEAVKQYNASGDIAGYKTRVSVIEKSKQLTRAMIDPGQMATYLLLNV